ncbi:MAG: hypothetical protein JNK97_01515, partial [Zoogloea sp.]|nr:hypothetical protein [Zoogloea sp.]
MAAGGECGSYGGRPVEVRGLDRVSFPFPEVPRVMTKYVFVTGGVVSSLGKGIAAASLGA